MSQEISTFEEMADAWSKAIERVIDAIAQLFDALARIFKRLCNGLIWFALKTMKTETRRVLKLNTYRSILRRKVALKGLILRLSENIV